MYLLWMADMSTLLFSLHGSINIEMDFTISTKWSSDWGLSPDGGTCFSDQ